MQENSANVTNLTQSLTPRVLVALDFDSAEQALALVDRLDPGLCRLKVGKELFTLAGPQLVVALQQRGFDVFLDLKFHDIPNTVAKAVSAAAKLGVWMVNVHASGGRRMMEAAAEALDKFSQPPLLIGVTVLTSMDSSELREINVTQDAAEQVLSLAALARDAGLQGVVCSAQEAQALKAAMGDEFLLVTPGIRPKGADAGDQRRIVTPGDAIVNGSDYLVIGRPVTKADDPIQTLLTINEEIASVDRD